MLVILEAIEGFSISLSLFKIFPLVGQKTQPNQMKNVHFSFTFLLTFPLFFCSL